MNEETVNEQEVITPTVTTQEEPVSRISLDDFMSSCVEIANIYDKATFTSFCGENRWMFPSEWDIMYNKFKERK